MKQKILNFYNRLKSIQARSTLIILVIAAVLIETTAMVQYWFASKGIESGAQYRAETELKIASLHISKAMSEVEVAAQNMVWAIEGNLREPDSVYNASRRLVEKNPSIVGCGVAFVSNYYPEKGHWYEPYVAKLADGTIVEKQIGSDTHNYFEMSWYKKGLNATKGEWTEPYYDNAGARMMLCTYTLPLHDSKGRVVAVVGADISLEWLNSIINAHPIYPSSFNVVISREGQILVGPGNDTSVSRNISDVTARMEDTTVNDINRQMMAGDSGQFVVKENDGRKSYVFFAPIEGDAGWSMAVVCSEKEIYKELRTVSMLLFLLMIAGMALMGYLMYRSIRAFRRLQTINAEKERMGSELRIANAIQMGMLPKTFPPFPERNDLEVFGSIVPAKAVGGDLYDFFIRDEKLFFCVGDVSGKGVPASLVMAVTRSLYRSISVRESMPGKIMEAMNSAMYEMNDSSMFVTLFVGVLDLPTGRLHYCNAGHCAPLLIGATAGVLPVDSNIPVAVVNDWKFVSQEAIVSPQTTIFLYTDGLTEATNARQEQFGETRLRKAINQSKDNDPVHLIECMSEAVQTFVDGAEQSDDLTMLAVKYTKEQQAEKLHRSVTLLNDIAEVPRCSAFVQDVCKEVGFDNTTTMSINLAVEEAVVNVMNYAYPEGTKGNVNIEACANDVRLKFIITDSGKPFDPTVVEEADTTLSVEERPMGGLGIFLVRQLMDSINYEYVNEHNVLTLRKKLPVKE